MKYLVYKIVNIVNNKFYLGSTCNFAHRKSIHLSSLRNRRHHNFYLQRAFNKYGENKFKWEIVEKCNPEVLKKKEQKYLDLLPGRDKSYNLSYEASGGDLISYHPNRDEIVAKIKKGVRKKLKFRKKVDIRGKKNPNYGNKWSKELKQRVSEIVKKRYANMTIKERRKLSDLAKKRMRTLYSSTKGKKIRQKMSKQRRGCKNSFYGKNHSLKTKKILSEKNKGNLAVNSMKVQINGITYKSVSGAAKALKMNMTTVWFRIKSTNPKFKNWNEFGKNKKISSPRYGHLSKKVIAEGKIYLSATEAANAYNRCLTAILFRIRSSNPKWKDFKWA